MKLTADVAQAVPDQMFDIVLTVEPNGQTTTGVQAFIDFDASRLQVTAVTIELGSPLGIPLAQEFSNASGTVTLAVGTVGSGSVSSFVMGRVTFKALGTIGNAALSFSTISPRMTIASHLGQEIQRTLTGTQVSIQPLALVDMSINPQSISVQPSQPFSLDITVEPNGQTLTGVQAFLDFNPNSLQVVSIVAGSSSPLSIPLVNRFNNSVGTLDFAVGTFASGTNVSFVLAVVTMSGGASGVTTLVEFSTTSPRASTVSMGGDQIQRDLIGTSVSIHNAPGVPNLTMIGMMILAVGFLAANYLLSMRQKKRVLR